LVDVGGKSEATIGIDELRDDQGVLEVAVGDRIQAMVVSTAGGLTLSRRLALGAASLRQLEDAFRAGLADFGVFLELEAGIEGLIPLSETGVTRDADIRKAFPVGKEVEVVVAEVDAPARRIRLSVTAVAMVRETDEVRDYHERTEGAPAERFGSLADKFRHALKPRRQ
jgi:ribosomal protein S1